MTSAPNPFNAVSNPLMNADFTSSRFRGEYKTRFPSGEPEGYRSGDLILYEGKLFIATNIITSGSPDTNNAWVPLGNSRISYRSTQPPDPKVGDNWFNSATGKLYKYIDDGETKQFVEV